MNEETQKEDWSRAEYSGIGEGMKAYKGFDENLRCRGFQYEVGETYKHEGEVEICNSGFHFCKDLVLCFEFYPFSETNRFAEVEIVSKPIWDEVGHKGVASEIKIVREIPREEILALIDAPAKQNSGYRNSGNRNSGNWNSGNRNSGNSNSGNWNSGNRNSGNSNSGDWNSCNHETGAFNTKTPETINVFNKPCSRKEWGNAYKPVFLYFTQAEGQSYKEAFQESWENADEADRARVKDLPNFDADVFFEISGIRV